jgi:hypothetical protein
MASKLLITTAKPAINGELSVLSMSDEQIMNQIYATHVHADEKFDADSLFVVVENVLKRATLIVDNAVMVNIYIYISFYPASSL